MTGESAGSDITTSGRSMARKNGGVIIFYVSFVVVTLLETVINRGLLFVAIWLHLNPVAFSWVMFIIGGSLLGFITMRLTPVAELRDPFIRAARWLWRKLWWGGFILAAVIVAGMGIAIIAKAEDRPHRLRLTIMAAVVFATFWVPIYTWAWH